MFAIYREVSGGGDAIRVFHDMQEALAWLNLPA